MPLKILALNCTLKPSPKASSTDKLIDEIFAAFRNHGGEGETVRVVDLNIKPGVTSDEGEGDDWPELRRRILSADVLVFGTPIWLGQPSSVAKRVCERMDAFLGETDDRQRMPAHGKVAVVAVVGNEDGAHHVGAELYQALVDVGFTIPASGMTYWVGEAMHGVDYKDKNGPVKETDRATQMMVSAAAHLAGVLKQHGYPGLD